MSNKLAIAGILAGLAIAGLVIYEIKKTRDDLKDTVNDVVDTITAPITIPANATAEGVGYTIALAENYPYRAKVASILNQWGL